MAIVIPFAARRTSTGEVVDLSKVRVGRSRAGEQGISEPDLHGVLSQDRPLATYALQLLGSEDPIDRRHGSVMLSRMAGTLAGPSDEPPTAA